MELIKYSSSRTTDGDQEMVEERDQSSEKIIEEVIPEEKEILEEPKKEEPKKKAVPKIFRSRDEEIEISVYGFYNSETGAFSFALPGTGEEPEQEEDGALVMQKHTFTFSVVPYDRLNIYRKRAGQYNSIDRSTTIDFLKFRDLLWAFHLRSWDLRDENGDIVELKRDPVDGTLTQESLEKLWQVPPMILDMVIQMFENESNIA